MFQDDRMIPILSAAVLMVVFGTILQRADGLDRWLGGEAPVEIVLRDDEVTVPRDSLLTIDVFANDDGIEEAMRDRLTVVSKPACGRLFVRSGLLDYLADAGCAGRQTIRYSFEGAAPEQVASVTAEIGDAGEPVASAADAPPDSAPAASRPEADPKTGAPALARADRPALEAGETEDTETAPGSPATPASAVALAGAHGSPANAPAAGAASTSVALRHGGRAASPAVAMGTAAASAAGSIRPTARELGMTAAASSEAIATGPESSPPGGPLTAPPPAVETAFASDPESTAERASRRADASPPHDRITESTAPPPDARDHSGSAEPRATGEAAGSPSAPISGADAVALAATPAEPLPAGGIEATASDRSPLSALPRPGLRPQSGAGPEPARTASAQPSASEGLSRSPAPPSQSRGREPVASGALAEASPRLSTAPGSVVERPVPGESRGATAANAPGIAAQADAIRVAALPAGADETGPAEPERFGIVLAGLLPPADADHASALGLHEDPTAPPARRLTARSQPAEPGSAPLMAAPMPPAPRVALAAGGPLLGPAGDESPSAASAAGGPAFVLSIVGPANAAAPELGADAATMPQAGGPAADEPSDEVLLAAIAPARLLGPALPGPALDVLPGDPEAPLATGRIVIPVPRPASFGGGDAGADPQTAAVPETIAPCLIVPGLILDIRGAGTTILGVDAPCQAGTVAELTYSGLSLAVPLDGNGQGNVTVLGFEPNTPAVVTFRDGMSLEFELPFRGVEKVSRIALAWDSPIELGLNALERGAAPNSPGHVRPGAARSFEEARETGGGYLGVWWPIAGVGQSVQIYSWYHRSSERPGVVRMLVDFVSRDRDHLASACGDGPDAAPEYTVLRSDAGRPEQPVTRRLAPIDCRKVAESGRDNRLISGAVDDLVITRN